LKNVYNKFKTFADSWVGSIIIILLIINFLFQAYLIPSGSMKSTLKVGDWVIVNKFKYGINVPYFPWIEVPLFPDINNNGHLVEGDKPERGDIVTFRYPKNIKTHFVKRCVAKEGDILYIKNKDLYIKFNESEEYIKNKYLDKGYKVIKHEGLGTFVKNPYSKDHKIRHDDKITLGNYEALSRALEDQNMVGMNEQRDTYLKLINYPTKKCEENKIFEMIKSEDGTSMVKINKDEYFMLGDNRENSHDSRFWGPINYKHVEGSPIMVLLSIDKDEYSLRFNRTLSFIE